jgi:PAS domain S-box-containing protein
MAGIVTTLIRRSRYSIVYLLCVGFCLCVIGGVCAAQTAPAGAVQRVLVIHSFGSSAPPFTTHSTAFQTALTQGLGKLVDLDEVSLDMARYQPGIEEPFVELLVKRFEHWQPDLVVPIGSPAGRFVAKFRHRLFPHAPVIYTGMDRRTLPPDTFENNATFVGEDFNLAGLIEDILQLAPDTNNIVVILGATPLERYWATVFRSAFERFAPRVKFTWVNDLSFDQMLELAAKLPPRSFILLGLLLRDASGVTHNEDEALQRLRAVANAPINGLYQNQLGLGIVGGRLYQGELQGIESARVAVRILRGEPISNFPPKIIGTLGPRYDWRELRRWNISESRLPPGSVIAFRQPTVWERYKWYILAALAIFGVQSAMIVDLLVQRRRRRQIQTELRESQQLMELATTAGEIGIWARDSKTDVIWANAPLRSMLGVGEKGTIRLGDLRARIHPDDGAQVTAEAQRAQEEDTPFEGELHLPQPDGTDRWLLSKERTVQTSQNSGMQRMGVVLDITERKRGEERFRLAVEAMPNAIVMVNQQGKIQMVNALTERLFGYAREELIGQSVEMLLPERFRAGHSTHRTAFFSAPQARPMGAGRDLFARRKDGSEFWMEVGLNPIQTPEGTLALTTIVDITERKHVESELHWIRQELAHLTRVATVGELTASVAHELNQPLGAILSNAEAAEMFLAAEPPALDEVRNILADIRKDDERAGEVIQRMRRLLRKQELAPKSIDINEALEEVIKLLNFDASARKVAVKFERTPDLPLVSCDPVHLQQVVLNLVLNGMDAMAQLPKEKRQVVVRSGLGDNGAVKIAVADSGPGIPADSLPKLFEPFFTTKKEGMGIGLSIARTIVQAHHGRIWAENNPGAGATFYFTMPFAEEPSA